MDSGGAAAWLEGVGRLHVVNGVLKTRGDGENAALLCFTFRIQGTTVYVIPKHLPASQCAAFVALAAEYGGTDLKRFVDIAEDVYRWTEQEFMDLLDGVDMADFMVETDKRKMLQMVSEAKLAETVALRPQPTLLFDPCLDQAELRVGAEHSVVISLDIVPPLFSSLRIELTCTTGGVVITPAKVHLRAPHAAATVQVVARLPGDHSVTCVVSGLNSVDIDTPEAKAVHVVSHETAVLESCIDTFSLVLETCEGRGDLGPFEYAVQQYFHMQVSHGTVCDVLTRMMERSLLHLLLATLHYMSDELLQDLCNMQFHHVPLCHWAIICEDLALALRLFQCASFNIITASTAVAVALIIDCEEFALDLMTQCTYLQVDGYLKGTTALCLAVAKAMHRVVTALLEKGADVNRPNSAGDTALYLCFESMPFKAESAKALLQTGRITWQGPPGKRNMEALNLAVTECHVDGLRYFLEAGCPFSQEFFAPLAVVIASDHPRRHEAAGLLIPEGQKAGGLDLIGPTGKTVLHTACGQLDQRLVAMLLDAAVDPLVSDLKGQTCIHHILADFKGDPAEELLRADILKAALRAIPLSMDQMPDGDGRTPLHLAAGYGTGYAQPMAITQLLEGGFQLSLDAAMKSPLHYAVASPQASSGTIMQLLRAVGGNIDGVHIIAPPHNDSVLALAIHKGMVDVVESICEKFMVCGMEKVFAVRSKCLLTPLLSALLYPTDGQGVPQDATAADRDVAVRMARAVLSATGVSLAPMETHPYATPLLLACQRAYGLIVSDLVRRAPPPADAGSYTFAALLGVPPYHVPDVFSGMPLPERNILLSSMFGQLLTYPYDETVAIPYTESGDEDQVRNLFQMVCAKAHPQLMLQFCNGVSVQWESESGQDVKEHPLTLILRADTPPSDKEQSFAIALPFLRDGLKLSPTVLMGLVQRCIEQGLPSLLQNLVGLHKMVVEALLPGGVTLLQLALTSPKIKDTETRAAVCAVLLEADVKVNMQGVADHGTALQEAIRQNMWSTIELISKAPKVDVSLTTNSCTKTPMILLLERVSKYPVEATQAIVQLLETGTVVDVEYDDTGGLKVNIASIACAKGLASVIYPLFKYGLLHDPKAERKDRYRFTSLAHRAVSAPRLVKDGEHAKHFGAGATLVALSGTGYLSGVMDVMDEKGFTPVTKAFHKGAVCAVGSLIELGAKYSRGKDGQPPASIVLNSQNVDDDVALQVLQVVADDAPLQQLNVVRDGKAALHMACGRGFLKTAEFLLAQKAEVNVLDGNHNTPLLCVVKSHSTPTERKAALLHLLLHTPGIQPAYGDSPLHWMFLNRRVDRGMLIALFDAPAHAQANLLALHPNPPKPEDKSVYVLAAKHVVEVSIDPEASEAEREDAVACVELLVAHMHDNASNLPEAREALHVLAAYPANPYPIRASLAMLSVGVDCGSLSASTGLTPLQTALQGLRDHTPSAGKAENLPSAVENTEEAQSVAVLAVPDSAHVSDAEDNDGDPPGGGPEQMDARAKHNDTTEPQPQDDVESQRKDAAAAAPPAPALHTPPTIVQYLKGLMTGRGFTPSVTDKQGRTLLHMALKLASDEIAVTVFTELLEHFTLHYDTCDINGADDAGKSILAELTTCALSVGAKTELLGQILQIMDVDPRLAGASGTILHYAVEKLPPAAINVVLQSMTLSQHIDRPEFWAERGTNGRTVVHSCFSRTDANSIIDVLDLLMQYSLVMNFALVDHDRHTPLMTAVLTDHWAAAGVLARAHCDSNGWTVLAPDGSCVLHALLGRIESSQEAVYWVKLVAPVLATEYASLDAIRGSEGETLVHVAARRCFTAVCDVLMQQYDCDPYDSSAHDTALHCCLAQHASRLTSTLCAMKILQSTPPHSKQYWTAPNRAGLTPLMLAARYGHVEVVEHLLGEGVDAGTLDPQGLGAFHHAVLFHLPDNAPSPDDTPAATEHERFARVMAAAEPNTHFEAVGLALLQRMDLTAMPRVREVTEAVALRGSLKLLKVLVEEAGTVPAPSIMETVLRSEDLPSTSAASIPSVAGYLAHHFRVHDGGAMTGLQHLRRCNEPYLCSTLAAGQPPRSVSSWLQGLGSALPPRGVEHMLQNFKRYAEHCELSSTLNRTPKYPLGSNIRLRKDEDAVFLMLLAQSPTIFHVSKDLLNRYVARLLVVHCGAPSEVSEQDQGLLKREAITEALMTVISPAALLLLCSTSVSARDKVLPPKGLIQPGAASLYATLRSLFEASLVFAHNRVMCSIVDSFRESPALEDLSMLETVAVERGDVDAVQIVFEARRRAGEYPSAGTVDSFFRRRVDERAWSIFEVLLHNRAAMTEQALLFLLEQGRVSFRNALGDTILHILVLHNQHALLEGFCKQVPHHRLLVSPDVKNVFGKRAIDYCGDKYTQEFGRIFAELREAGRHAVPGSCGDSPLSNNVYSRDAAGGTSRLDEPRLPPAPRNIPHVRYTVQNRSWGSGERPPSPSPSPHLPVRSPPPTVAVYNGTARASPFKYINGLVHRPRTPRAGQVPTPPGTARIARRGRPLAFEDPTPPVRPASPPAGPRQVTNVLSKKRTRGHGIVDNKGGDACIAVGSGRMGAAVVRKVW